MAYRSNRWRKRYLKSGSFRIRSRSLNHGYHIYPFTSGADNPPARDVTTPYYTNMSPQACFKWKFQRGGPEIAACPGMRSPWDRDVLWAQNSGTGPLVSRCSGVLSARDVSSARAGRFSCRVSAPNVLTCFPACLTKHPLLLVLRACARPQGGGKTSESWLFGRR